MIHVFERRQVNAGRYMKRGRKRERERKNEKEREKMTNTLMD